MKIKISELEQKVMHTLEKAGYSLEYAEMIKNLVMFGEVAGKLTHGVMRLYKGDLNTLENRGEGEIEIVEKSRNSAVVRANKHPGTLVGHIGMNKALEFAAQEKIGMVTTTGTFSTSGCLTYYLEQIALKGYIGIVMSQSAAFVAPFNSAEALFGTNPMGFAFPTNHKPLLFDMATSIISFGAILSAANSGKTIPEKVALDKDGKFTTDANEALEGSVLSFDNSYKGSGLGMVVEILGGVLAGGSFIDLHKESGWGNFFMVLSPELFMPLDQFRSRMDEFIERTYNAKTKDGEKLRLPGMKTLSTRDENLLAGEIEVAEEVLAGLAKYL